MSTIKKPICDSTTSDIFIDYYKYILNNPLECIWVYSLTSNCFIYISPSVYHLRGLTVAEAMNQSFTDIFTPSSLKKINTNGIKRYQQFLAGSRSDAVISSMEEYDVYCKDSSIITIETSSHFIFNEKNNSTEIIGVFRNSTKREASPVNMLNQLRLTPKKFQENSSMMDNHPQNIRIYFFHNFRVYGANHTEPLHWHTSKNEELFAFLLFHENKTINKYEIIENLWPNLTLDYSVPYLHNTLYSMKKDLLTVGIELKTEFKNNNYTYYIADYYSDVKHFARIVKNSLLPIQHGSEEFVRQYEELIKLYQGDFLNRNGYFWSLCASASLNEQFKEAASKLSNYYFYKLDYSSAKRILLQTLEIDGYDETAHELLLKVYLQNHEYSAFLQHYAKLEVLLRSECQTKPKHSIQLLYHNYFLNHQIHAN